MSAAQDDYLLSHEPRPVGHRRLLHRLVIGWRHGEHREVDLLRHNVRLDGHWITRVSPDVARDLLGAPFTSPSEQATRLQHLVRYARSVGGHYRLPVVRTRWFRRSTVADVYIVHEEHDRWVAYWWYEDYESGPPPMGLLRIHQPLAEWRDDPGLPIRAERPGHVRCRDRITKVGS